MNEARALLPHPLRPLADRLLRRFAAGLVLGLTALSLACQSENDMSPAAAANGTPSARFTTDRTSGPPGLEVQFSDASTGDVTDYAWDFGAAGTRTERNPRVRFDDPGVYTVRLTVTGPGGTSTLAKTSLIEVDEPPTAGFACLPARSFAPMTTLCSDASSGATSFHWDFGDGTTSTDASPTHVYGVPGHYTVTQTARSAGGTDTATAEIDVLPISITLDPPTSVAPATVHLTADVGGVTGLGLWTIDNQVAGISLDEVHVFRHPGTYKIAFMFGELGTGASGMVERDYVVGYSPAVAGFTPKSSEGTGPMTVAFEDRSTGAVTSWHWNFGDGSECLFPAPAVASGIPICSSASPSHVYDKIGSYTVSLAVTGPPATPGAPEIQDSESLPNAVRVLMLDASFEAQTANGAIGGAWTALRPTNAVASATHRALSKASGGGEAGMPTDGDRWAVLDGLGTNGATPVETVENGIRQAFLRPKSKTVLELDYALLFAEPPAGIVRDAVTATVSDGTTTVEIPSARTDVASPWTGVSTRYPTRDGSTVRVTPTFTAAIDLAAAFPSSTPDSTLTLTIRVGNASNEFRSPRAYVDRIRFVAPTVTPQIAQFSVDAAPIVAGQDVVFTDESCLDPGTTGCQAPTSWRWDFGTRRLSTPPASSGSRERSPTYRFPTPGTYDVKLRVARAEQESEATLTVQVVGGPVAAFDTLETAPFTAPATLHFQDHSTFDPTDPIVAWQWDFGGWGTSSQQAPPPVTIGQVGDWLIRLRVTTASGQTQIAESVLTVE